MVDMRERLNKIIEIKRGFNDEIKAQCDKIIENIYNLPPLRKQTVAVVESYKNHGEVYPSIIKYFLDLGYRVDLFNLEAHKKLNPLEGCHFDENKFREFTFPVMPYSPKFFNLLNQYEYIFLPTLFDPQNGYNFAQALYETPIKEKLYCIDHDFISLERNIETIEQTLIKEKRVFTLRSGIMGLPYLSPVYLSDNTNMTAKSDIINFITIGGANSNNIRNFSLLFDVVNRLIDENEKFTVTFVGAKENDLNQYINSKNKPYLNVLGKLSYLNMYREIEKADFILFNTDETCSEYQKYLDKGATGSYTLSISFIKPSIIDEELSKVYNFKDCSIPYKTGELYSAMKEALKMQNEKYSKMQMTLFKMKLDLEEKSRKNLRETLR